VVWAQPDGLQNVMKMKESMAWRASFPRSRLPASVEFFNKASMCENERNGITSFRVEPCGLPPLACCYFSCLSMQHDFEALKIK
jgi:hypothetical protein